MQQSQQLITKGERKYFTESTDNNSKKALNLQEPQTIYKRNSIYQNLDSHPAETISNPVLDT